MKESEIEKIRKYYQDLYQKDPHRKDLTPCTKPCLNEEGKSDCAVITRFYLEDAEGLKKLTKEEQLKYAKSWNCHNEPNTACKGLWDYLNLKVAEDE